MKALSFLSVLFIVQGVFAMGNSFRSIWAENPYPVGVDENCAQVYRNSQPQLMPTYDISCLYIKKSQPIEVGPSCQYNDYTPNEKYLEPGRIEVLKTYQRIITEKALSTLKVGFADVETFKSELAGQYARPIGLLENELLTGKYCQQAVPQNPRAAFNISTDVPASLISLWDEKYISNRWNQAMPTFKIANPETDFDTLVELNLQGARIWSKMLSCAHGDAELARYQYFTTQFTCDDGSDLKSEIKNYVQSIRIFFTTSFIRPANIRVNSSTELALAIMTNREVITSKYEPFPTLHPLFLQGLLQILTSVYPVGSREQPSYANFIRRLGTESAENHFVQALAQLDFFLPEGLYYAGLWPSANYTVFSQIQRVRNSLLKEVTPGLKVQFFKGIAVGGFSRLPDFYDQYRPELADEVREMNKRYGLMN